MAAVATFRGVHKEYALGAQTVAALRGVDFQIGEGEFVALVGPSGSGKSSVLNLVGCIDVPTRGDVLIGTDVVSNLPEQKRAKLRLHRLGFIFQNFSLIPVLNVMQNIELPLLLRGGVAAGEARAKAADIVARVGLSGHEKKLPSALSGGQQQRVAIARALVGRPSLIIADEPTANLDHKTGRAIMELMAELNRVEKATVLYSTHDPEMMALAHRSIRMQDGAIVSGEG